MDVSVKHPWHEQLHQLDGLPLVACGGDKRPYQKAWQTKSLTPEQIIAEGCAAVGLRCGTDSKIVGVDLDGNTALRLAMDAKCEPYEHNTWIRERPNAADRTMVLFAVPEFLWPLLPNKKIVHITKEGGQCRDSTIHTRLRLLERDDAASVAANVLHARRPDGQLDALARRVAERELAP